MVNKAKVPIGQNKFKALVSKHRIWMNMSRQQFYTEIGIKEDAYYYKVRHMNFTYPELLRIFSVLEFGGDEIASLFSLGDKDGRS